MTHGDLPAPNVEQLGPYHDSCTGGAECEAMCTCDGGE